MVTPILVPIAVALAIRAIPFSVGFVMLHCNFIKLKTLNELLRQIKSFHSDVQELEIFEDEAYFLSKGNEDMYEVYFEPEKKSIINTGFSRSIFTSQDEEHSMIKFDIFGDFDSEPSSKGPTFKEFWLNKSQDSRAKELINKEDAYKGRQFIKIETFLYIDELESRMKYQEKSFWLSDEGITITSKNVNVPPSSKEKIYIAEITVGEFEFDKSGELCAVDKGVIRMKMTREGLDINDKNCSTGLTYINAKTSLEELLEGEAQRVANKKAKPSAGQSKPSTNLDGMELRKRGAERS